MSLNTPQPPPQPTTGPDVWPLVIAKIRDFGFTHANFAKLVADCEERNQIGTAKYGVPLRVGDGRDSLIDAYQECLDLIVYLAKAAFERQGNVAVRVRLDGIMDSALFELSLLRDIIDAEREDAKP